MLHSAGIDSVPTAQLLFTDSTQLALSMAASGYGLALARAPTTDRLVNNLGLKAIECCPGLPSREAYYLIYRNLESLPAAAQNFRDWLLREVGKLVD